MILHLTLLPEHQSVIFLQCLSVQHANLAKAFQQCGRVSESVLADVDMRGELILKCIYRE